jgi:uncharacterized protein with GYD domain
MLFITCVRINPGQLEAAKKFADQLLKSPPKGVKILKSYHTLGRYDAILIYEAADPKMVKEFLQGSRDVATTETWVAFERT